MPLAFLALIPAPVAAAGVPRTPTVHPAGGEARGAVRLEVRTNGATGTEVRVRADEPLLRVYRLTNQAEYRLTVTTLKDAQVSGAPVVCGGEQPLVLPPLGVVECSATLPARSGPQRTEVRVEAAAPKGMPSAVAATQAGYRGLVAGLVLTRVGLPTGSGVLARADRSADRSAGRSTGRSTGWTAADDAFLPAVRTSGPRALPMVAGGDVRLRYRVDAVGDSSISAVSVAEHLPGVGPVSCTGQSAAGLLEPGRPLDCAASGAAVPGRHTGVARAEGLAADGAVGQDGRPLPPRPVAAEAAGDYEGQGPAPAQPGAGPAPAPPGAAPGAGTGAGPTTVGRPPAPAAGAAAPAAAVPGAAGVAGSALPPNALPPNALPPNPAAPNAAAAPAGSAAVPNAAANGAAAAPAAAAAAAAAPGAAAAAAAAAGSAVPYRPGTSTFGLPASPFQAASAVGAAGAAGSAGAAAGGTGDGAPGGPGSGPGTGSGPGAPSAGPGRSAESAVPNPKGNTASVAQIPDDAPFDRDEDWDTNEVMLMMLAIMLPVLVVLAAAMSARQREGSGPGGGGGD
ncbi:hypothetical protein [Kitasatospora purpeofusca]|uniref:hypothetical protein n=1 Tax=Kitasatospora purpeofusca TaxID=67352 RepID=UPI002A5A1918|nr:hypothetical protein [Kitasatospora purpeofusca]MDY0810360.1 hypothetical protein [Kitasatospora purpeofusca]